MCEIRVVTALGHECIGEIIPHFDQTVQMARPLFFPSQASFWWKPRINKVKGVHVKKNTDPIRTQRKLRRTRTGKGERRRKSLRFLSFMETGISGSSRREAEKELKLKKETLQSLLEQCQRALESIRSADGGDDSYDSDNGDDSASVSSSQGGESETAEVL